MKKIYSFVLLVFTRRFYTPFEVLLLIGIFSSRNLVIFSFLLAIFCFSIYFNFPSEED